MSQRSDVKRTSNDLQGTDRPSISWLVFVFAVLAVPFGFLWLAASYPGPL